MSKISKTILVGEGENSCKTDPKNIASGDNSFCEGSGELDTDTNVFIANEANGDCAHAEGLGNKANGWASHVEGRGNIVGKNSDDARYGHAEGRHTVVDGQAGHAEGYYTEANGNQAHAEGSTTVASGVNSHAEGGLTVASNEQAHAEGLNSVASGVSSHAEGNATVASGIHAHAEGDTTLASGEHTHAEGNQTKAVGGSSHAEGYKAETTSAALNSHAEGHLTKATRVAQHVQGVSNYLDANGDAGNFADIIGGGDYGGTQRKNLETLDWNGNLRVKGKVYIQANDDGTGGTELGTGGSGSIQNLSDGTGAGSVQQTGCHATGANSAAFGVDTNAKKNGQFVVGDHNADDNDAVFIVGSGSGPLGTTPSNAFSVRRHRTGDDNTYGIVIGDEEFTEDDLGGTVKFNQNQSLSEYQKNTVRNNIGIHLYCHSVSLFGVPSGLEINGHLSFVSSSATPITSVDQIPKYTVAAFTPGYPDFPVSGYIEGSWLSGIKTNNGSVDGTGLSTTDVIIVTDTVTQIF